MSPMNFCSQCGHKLVATWNVCPNCGNILKLERVPQKQAIQTPPPQQLNYQQKPTRQLVEYHSRNNNTNGIIALIFGLLGLIGSVLIVGSILLPVFGIIGGIFGFSGILGQFVIVGLILGIVFGAIGRKKDDDSRMASAGFSLGIIGIVIWIAIFSILFFSIFRSFYYYMPD